MLPTDDGETFDDFERDLRELVRAVARASMEDVYAPQVKASLDAYGQRFAEIKAAIGAAADAHRALQRELETRQGKLDTRLAAVDASLAETRAFSDRRINQASAEAGRVLESKFVELDMKLRNMQTQATHAADLQIDHTSIEQRQTRTRLAETDRIAMLRFRAVMFLLLTIIGLQVWAIHGKWA